MALKPTASDALQSWTRLLFLRSYAFFRRVALETLESYPQIDAKCTIVDAMTAHLMQQPEHFGVFLTENTFGDILSDLGAATLGGLGITPSAEFGADQGYFQGIHGSAPDIAGRGVANPTATILSVCVMLDWLGEKRQIKRFNKPAIEFTKWSRSSSQTVQFDARSWRDSVDGRVYRYNCDPFGASTPVIKGRKWT